MIAYNRERALKRLLFSLAGADYPEGSDVTLIISIDKSDNEGVLETAREFDWEYGEKRIITHAERLGLKRHVLECGDHSEEYGSVILLEDDLFVAPDFYNYASAALDFTGADSRVGGVSLYNHLLNVHVREPFFAIEDGFDSYYMQLASSWGQAYTMEQWNGFAKWMENASEDSLTDMRIPENVRGWSESSWLKYNIAYLIERDMYFLYPRTSLTTNFMSEGEHSGGEDNDLQVPLGIFAKKEYRFGRPEGSSAIYDAFFENTCLKALIAERFSLPEQEICIDLYGCRSGQISKGTQGISFLLSPEPLPFKVLASYGRRLRPIDANIIFAAEGRDFFLYDLREGSRAPGVDKGERYLYNYRALSFKKIRDILGYRLRKYVRDFRSN